MGMSKAKIAILGASGYTGAELVRMLALHPGADIRILTADRKAGQKMIDVFPHLGDVPLPDLISINDADFSSVDSVFCCLPHGTTQEVIAGLPTTLKIVDLSADFRLRDPATYAEWYGHPHQAEVLQTEAVYGLTEWARADVARARLIANPGCYPTSILLPLVPLLRKGLIETTGIIADSKSGVSGAGRAAKEANLYTEVTEGIHAYGIAGHRHLPEIEQELGVAAGTSVAMTFTPHLMPMSRGMLSTIYVRLGKGQTVETLKETLEATYRDEPFVRVLPGSMVPATRHVRGSNYCLINVFADRVPGQVIICSVIDNLVKGASGQAIQNFNVQFGFDETTGLRQQPMFP